MSLMVGRLKSRAKYLVLVAVALATMSLVGGAPAVAANTAAPTVTSSAGFTMNSNSSTVDVTFTTGADVDGTTGVKAVGVELVNFAWGSSYSGCYSSWYCSDFSVTATDASANPIDMSNYQFTAATNNYQIMHVSVGVNDFIAAGATFHFTINTGRIQPKNCSVPAFKPTVFQGWFEGTALEVYDSTPVTVSKKVVTFKANNLSITDADKNQCGSSAQTLTANPFHLSNYSFMGWNTAADGSGTNYTNRASYAFTSDVTLYAQWSATNQVVLTTSGGFVQGVSPNPITVSFLTKEPLPAGSSYSSHGISFTLNGITNDAFTRYANCNTTAPCSSINLTSSSGTLASVTKYVSTQSSNSVYVTFYTGLNTIPAGTTLTLNLPADKVSLTGSSFAYARTMDSAGTLEQTGYTYFNAQAVRAVTYDTGGGDPIAPANIVGAIPAPAATKAGYTIAGWYTAATGGTLITFPYSPVATTLTIYARWTANTNVVTYDTDGGSSVANGSFVTGGTLTLPAAPTKANHTFLGWFAAASGGTALVSGYSPAATSAMTLYAHWQINSVAVTYDTDGGSAVANGVFTPGSSLTLPADPTKAGYAFDGWFEAATGGTALVSGYSPAAATAFTLYAHWTANSNTVHYDTNGGSAVANGHFTTGGTLTLASAPTKAGYTFDGWYAAATGGSALVSSYSPAATSGITLYAHWTANNNTVRYEVDGGSAVANGSFVTGGTLTLAPVPTKADYSFDGWFEAATGGTALVSGYSPSATAGITLYAHWTPLSRVVTFDANGGSNTQTQQRSLVAAPLDASVVERSGYYFDGWNSAADGSGTVYAEGANYDFASNLTLYAQWREIPLKPVATINIDIPLGKPVADAPVELVADGLLDRSHYTVTVHSSPQIVDEGTIWSGRLNTVIRIPSNLEAGWHRLIIEGTAADGTPWTETNYFKVTANGLLGAVAKTSPPKNEVDSKPTPEPVAEPTPEPEEPAEETPEDISAAVSDNQSVLVAGIVTGSVAIAVLGSITVRRLGRKRLQK